MANPIINFTLTSGQETAFVIANIEAVQRATDTTAYIITGGESYEVTGDFAHVRTIVHNNLP